MKTLCKCASTTLHTGLTLCDLSEGLKGSALVLAVGTGEGGQGGLCLLAILLQCSLGNLDGEDGGDEGGRSKEVHGWT